MYARAHLRQGHTCDAGNVCVDHSFRRYRPCVHNTLKRKPHRQPAGTVALYSNVITQGVERDCVMFTHGFQARIIDPLQLDI